MKMIRRNPFLQALILSMLLPAFVWLPESVQSNPQGGEVIFGEVEIFDPEGNTQMIDQLSSRAIIEWESFSIGGGELTQFNQPGTHAAILNRVTGGSISQIDGALKANGSVWLINQNGVIVGPGGVVDAFGFLASTLDVNNEAFMGGGDVTLSGGSQAMVQNFGTINGAGGDLVLAGRRVENHGTIGGVDSYVGMAGGNSVLFKAQGDQRIFISAGENSSVLNAGEIRSAAAELRAHGNVGALAIQNTGVIRANGAANIRGKVVLQSNFGNISNTGVIGASNLDGSGGAIELVANMGEIHIANQLTASGITNGGQVKLMGDLINISEGSQINADGGTSGGAIEMTANNMLEVKPGAIVSANGQTVGGGRVDAKSFGDIVIYPGSTIVANGETNGGNLNVAGAGRVTLAGQIGADGGAVGNGGNVQVTGEDIIVEASATVSASGKNNGGSVTMAANDQMVVAGGIAATGQDGKGGRIALSGTDVLVNAGGNIDAGGASGGTIGITGTDQVIIAGSVSAVGTDGEGGAIGINGKDVIVAVTGVIDAGGSNGGGRIGIDARDTAQIFGTVTATGGDGAGGVIGVRATDILVGPTGVIDAGGASGGFVTIAARDHAEVNGTVRAVGSNGSGGTIGITGNEVLVGATAVIDGSGARDGGTIAIGGGYQGNDAQFRNARNTTVAAGAQIRASATSSGNGGNVFVWADGKTDFAGNINAKGAGAAGEGGFAEVSGKQNLTFNGSVQAQTLLLDPTDIDLNAATALALRQTLEDGTNTIIHTNFGIGGGGNINVTSDLRYGSDANLAFFAQGSIFVNATIQNHGGGTRANGTQFGNISLVAGWTPGGTGFAAGPVANAPASPALDFATIRSGAFGTVAGVGGDVFIGSGAIAREVEVGSAAGETNIIGRSITVSPGNNTDFYTQIGYRRTREFVNDGRVGGVDLSNREVSVSGNINLYAPGNILLLGAQEGARRRIQVGHGGDSWVGSRTTANSQFGLPISNTNGQIRETLTGATNAASGFFDAAHLTRNTMSVWKDEQVLGFIDNSASATRVVTLTTPGTAGFTTFRHGYTDGQQVRMTGTSLPGGLVSGRDYFVINRTQDTFQLSETSGGPAITTTSAGSGQFLAAGAGRIGVYDPTGDTLLVNQVEQNWSGDINVESGGSLLLIGGRDESFTQIGHAYFNNRVNDDDRTDQVWIEGGPLRANLSGDINVRANLVALIGGHESDSWAKIGHGGREARGIMSGAINVTGNTGVIGTANTRNLNGNLDFVQIGHGGFQVYHPLALPALGGPDGDVTRFQVNTNLVTATNPGYGFFGSGSKLELNDNHVVKVSFIDGNSGTYSGRVSSLTALGGQSSAASEDLTGTAVTRDYGLANTANANFYWTADNSPYTNVRAGINNIVGGVGTGINAAAAGKPSQTQRNDFAALVGGGVGDDNIVGETINPNPSTIFKPAAAATPGATVLTPSTEVVLASGVDLGSGGNITVRAPGGSVNFEAGVNSDDFAMIGHGGYRAPGSHTGQITVQAGGATNPTTGRAIIGNVALNHDHQRFDVATGAPGNSWGSDRAFAQIGHGGAESNGSHNGNIGVSATGSVTLEGGEWRGFARIGHGGEAVDGSTTTGDLATRRRYVQGTLSGNISVDAGGDIVGRAGYWRERNHVQIGHGGFVIDAAPFEGHNGNISVNAGGMVDFFAGRPDMPNAARVDTYAQIGHGGWVSRGDHWGNIQVSGTNGVYMVASAGYDGWNLDTDGSGGRVGENDAFDQNGRVQPGYGVQDDQGPHRNIFRRTYTEGAHAQIGHGGRDADHVDTVSGSNSVGIGVLGAMADHNANLFDGNTAVLAPTAVGYVASNISIYAGIDPVTGAVTNPNANFALVAPNHGELITQAAIDRIHTNTNLPTLQQLLGDPNAPDYILNVVPVNLHGHVGVMNQTLTNEFRDQGFRTLAALPAGFNPLDPATWTEANRNAISGGVLFEYRDGNGAGRFAVATAGGNLASSLNRLIIDGASGTETDGAGINSNIFTDRNGHGIDTTGNDRGDVFVIAFPDPPVGHALNGVVNLPGVTGNGDLRLGTPLPWADDAYAQVGHGGRDTGGEGGAFLRPLIGIGGGHAGSISINAANDVHVIGSDLERVLYGETNDGGTNVDHDVARSRNGGDNPSLHFNMAEPNENYVQIGHGGQAARGSHFGDILVNAGRNITAINGANTRSYTQIGHGGYDADHRTDDELGTVFNFDSLSAEYSVVSIARYAGNDRERLITGSRNWFHGFHQNIADRLFAEGWITQGNNSTELFEQDFLIHSSVFSTNQTINGTTGNAGDPVAGLYVNGVLEPTAAGAPNGSNNTLYKPGHLRLGARDAGESSDGEIQEMLIFNFDLDATQRANVEAYLASKWGRPAPPTGDAAAGAALVAAQTPNTLALHLDAGSIDGANNSTLTDGQAISGWRDLSGNNRHALTRVGTPFYVADSAAATGIGAAVAFETATNLNRGSSMIGDITLNAGTGNVILGGRQLLVTGNKSTADLGIDGGHNNLVAGLPTQLQPGGESNNTVATNPFSGVIVVDGANFNGAVTTNGIVGPWTRNGLAAQADFDAQGRNRGVAFINPNLPLGTATGQRNHPANLRIFDGRFDYGSNGAGEIQEGIGGAELNRYASVQVGHGGNLVSMDTMEGDIEITAGGGIDLLGGKGFGENFAQIGHGGGADGRVRSTIGNITLTSGTNAAAADGDINILAGNGRRAWAIVGHGGRDNDAVNDDNGVDTQMRSGNTSLFAGVNSTTWAVTNANSSVNLNGGNGDNFSEWRQQSHFRAGAQLVVRGLGNSALAGAGNPNPGVGIDQDADNGREFRDWTGLAGSGESWAQIGHNGAYTRGTAVGHIEVRAADEVNVIGGDGFTSRRLIDGQSHTTTTTNGAPLDNQFRDHDFLFQETGAGNSARIGHGGYDADGHFFGNVTVSAYNDITVRAGAFEQSEAQIGHGGRQIQNGGGNRNGAVNVGGLFPNDRPLISGDVTVESYLGSVTVEGSVGLERNDFDFNLNANSLQMRRYLGNPSQSQWSYAQIGHGAADFDITETPAGGLQTDGLSILSVTHDASLTNLPTNNLVARDQFEFDSFTAIDSAAEEARHLSLGALTNNITVTAGKDLFVLGGTVERDAFAMVGHGGISNDVVITDGDITVTVGRDLVVQRGSARGRSGVGADGTGVLNASLALGSLSGNTFAGADTTRMEALATGADMSVYTQSNGVALASGDGSAYRAQAAGSGVVPAAGVGVDASLYSANNQRNITSAWAKIGHGDQRYSPNAAFFNHTPSNAFTSTTNRRTPGGPSDRWEGDVAVAVGDDAFFNAALVGHVDLTTANVLHAGVTNLSGDTVVGVGRIDATGSDGVLRTDASTVFSSAGSGISGALRFYAPTRANLAMAAGTLLNGAAYPGVPALAAPQRGDEFLPFPDFTFTNGAHGEPTGTFIHANPYPIFNGLGLFYDINLADLTTLVPGPNPFVLGTPIVPPVVPPGGGGGDGGVAEEEERRRPVEQPIVVEPPVVLPPNVIPPPFDPTPGLFNIFQQNFPGSSTFDGLDYTLSGDIAFGVNTTAGQYPENLQGIEPGEQPVVGGIAQFNPIPIGTTGSTYNSGAMGSGFPGSDPSFTAENGVISLDDAGISLDAVNNPASSGPSTTTTNGDETDEERRNREEEEAAAGGEASGAGLNADGIDSLFGDPPPAADGAGAAEPAMEDNPFAN